MLEQLPVFDWGWFIILSFMCKWKWLCGRFDIVLLTVFSSSPWQVEVDDVPVFLATVSVVLGSGVFQTDSQKLSC